MTLEKAFLEIDSVIEGAYEHIAAKQWELLASDIGHIRGLVDAVYNDRRQDDAQ